MLECFMGFICLISPIGLICLVGSVGSICLIDAKMGTIKRFEELECWKDAGEFVKTIYKLTKKENFKKDFELVGQFKRSAISSMSNIAEGFHRNSNRDFMKFLDYPRSSIAETVSHCYVALDQDYINEEEMNQIDSQANIVWKKVNNFIIYLNNNT